MKWIRNQLGAIDMILIVIAFVVAVAAFYFYTKPLYLLQGVLISADDKQPVQNATISKGSISTKTDSNGNFELRIGRSKDAQISITADKYDSRTVSLASSKSSRTGLFASKITINLDATPTVQEEASRKWSYIKYEQDDKVWSLINPDLQKSIPQDKYAASLKQSIAQVTDAGGNLGDQTIASAVTLQSWKEPITGKVYSDVRELQTTQSYSVFGQTVNKNFVTHWVKSGEIWTFFANPNDPQYPAE